MIYTSKYQFVLTDCDNQHTAQNTKTRTMKIGEKILFNDESVL